MNKKNLTRIKKQYKPKGRINSFAPGSFVKKANAAAETAFNKDNIGGTMSAILGGVGDIVSIGMDNAEVDTAKADNAIDAVNSFTPATSSLNDLANSYNSLNFANTDYDAKDFRVGTKEGLLNMGKAALSGASAGSVAGPWGALAGAAAGLISSGSGWIAGAVKSKEEEDRLEREAKLANLSAVNKAINARDNIMEEQTNNLLMNIASKGGPISHQHGGVFSNGITIIGNGGTHEENPFEGVQLGVDPEGVPNMVEEGEVIWNDYVFSNRLQPPKEFKKKYKVKGDSFADIAKEMQKESEERPNDPISKRGLESNLVNLIISQEEVRNKDRERNKEVNIFWGGGSTNNYTLPIDTEVKDNPLRQSPILGSLIGTLDSFLSRPDYSSADLIQEEAKRASQYTPIGYTPITNRLTYKPLDRNFYLSKLGDLSLSSKRAIAEQAPTSGAAIAGILASDYNTQNKMGEVMRQAEEFDIAQRQAVEDFNRKTNLANAEMAMKASSANNSLLQAANKLRLEGAIKAAALRDQQDLQRSQAQSANLTTLFDNIGNYGTDLMNRDSMDMLIESGVIPTLSSKPSWWNDDQWVNYLAKKKAEKEGESSSDSPDTNVEAFGGRIKRKKKGLIY